ncbi:MAG: SEL1-like repeat protein [Myxococcales bacterium]|nr:SEL1-like repeat protein [Myxococcales bacterium]
MELLTGQTLLGLVEARGALPFELALEILRQLAHAMDAAHAAGVVHRDLKPENIFLSESRRTGSPFFVKVLDFGIAHIVREAQITRTDAIGTPLWMSPEQAGAADEIGPGTDIWALGLIVFYLLTGRPYWLCAREPECSALSLVREVCLEPLALARERAGQVGFDGPLPEGFDAWFSRCVCREMAGRFPSAGVAIEALAEAFGAPPVGLPSRDLIDALAGSGEVDVAHAPTELVPSTARSRLAPTGSGDAKPERAVVVESAPLPQASASATPAQPPGVSVTKPELGAEARRAPRRVLVGALVVGALVVGGLVWRSRAGAATARRDLAACSSSADAAACGRACARGAVRACARAALGELDARDPEARLRAQITLRAACTQDVPEACAALGRALVFPADAAARDLKQGIALLERGCSDGPGCALLGTLKDLGTPDLARDARAYFDAACKESPISTEELLDCGLTLAHALEGPPGRSPPARLAPLRTRPWRDLCAVSSGDLCALAWLDPATPPGEERAALERGCDSGSSLSCNNLGVMRAEGLGGAQPNPALAREAFERACVAGEPAGCNNLAFVAGGLSATPRRGPRGAAVYKLRCGGPFQVGCAGWGTRVDVVPRGTPTSYPQAAAALERACAGGLTTGCVNLGAFLFTGRAVPRDRPRAERLFAESCFRGDASACGEQGAALLAVRMDHRRDTRAGLGFVDRACKGGELDSCMALEAHKVNGLPEPKHEREGALGLSRLASLKVYTHAHSLSTLYETGGPGLERSPERARALALEECEVELRCTDAAYYLSRAIGGPKDERRAVELLGRACEASDLASCGELGARYRDGRGVGRDPSRAIELLTRACDAGDSFSCNDLALAYARAEGVGRDPARALALARASCESGGADGCATVGIMLADGVGTPKDPAAAAPYLGFGCRRAVQAACEKLQAMHKPLPELDL